MRRLRVGTALRKELESRRDGRGIVLRGGVMRVPQILDCDSWEEQAAIQQDALIDAASEDRGIRETENVGQA